MSILAGEGPRLKRIASYVKYEKIDKSHYNIELTLEKKFGENIIFTADPTGIYYLLKGGGQVQIFGPEEKCVSLRVKQTVEK